MLNYFYDAGGRNIGYEQGFPQQVPNWAGKCAAKLNGQKPGMERMLTLEFLPGGSVPNDRCDSLFEPAGQIFDYLEWIAKVTCHIPEKGAQLVHYYGAYSNAHRGKRAKFGGSSVAARRCETSWESKIQRAGADNLRALSREQTHPTERIVWHNRIGKNLLSCKKTPVGTHPCR
ncbi:hypothetical protein L0222_12690 [bacterium]|nr:hypothetical protein [bacterium]MCI0607312.1 hypothetical protein [bacterium]